MFVLIIVIHHRLVYNSQFVSLHTSTQPTDFNPRPRIDKCWADPCQAPIALVVRHRTGFHCGCISRDFG